MSLVELIAQADERGLAASGLACLDRCVPLLGGDDEVLRPLWANLAAGSRDAAEQRTRVPVLQLVPTLDVAVRPATAAASDPYAETIERRRLPHGHWVAHTHPQVVAAEVAGFVREHSVTASTTG